MKRVRHDFSKVVAEKLGVWYDDLGIVPDTRLGSMQQVMVKDEDHSKLLEGIIAYLEELHRCHMVDQQASYGSDLKKWRRVSVKPKI